MTLPSPTQAWATTAGQVLVCIVLVARLPVRTGHGLPLARHAGGLHLFRGCPPRRGGES
jgi:hypothetical protein